MKTIIRNFISIIRRYKVATALNVLGLSVAFAAFIVIMMQVRYEQTFDRCHPNYKNIYRVDLKWENGDGTSILARAMVDAVIASSPQVKEGTLINPWLNNIYVTVGDSSERKGFREKIVTCYPNITRIFGFDFTEGDMDCLTDPEKAIIPQSMAHRLFGSAPATGKIIEAKENIWTKFGIRNLTVGGVYRDFPDNTQLENAIYMAIDNTMIGDWGMRNFFCYLLFDTKEAASTFEQHINNSIDLNLAFSKEEANVSIQLMPLNDIYYHKGEPPIKTGDAGLMRIIFSIAILVIIIAAINFTNFSVALAPMRIRSINTQKILGSTTGTLRTALSIEAILIASMSWLLSIFIVWMLNRYQMLSFIEADTSIAGAMPVIILTGCIALITGFIAGIYPAWYVTSFQPAMVLKGSFALSPSGRFLRTGLIGFQYIISTGLIIGAIFIQIQNKYMKDFTQGFDKEQIALVEISGDIYRQSKDVIINRLKAFPEIENVAFARQKIGGGDMYSQYSFRYLNEQFYAHTIEVTSSFLDLMHIPVIEGRDFMPSEEYPSAQHIVIFSKLLHDRIPVEINNAIHMDGWEVDARVVGVIGDIKITSARHADYPMLFMLNSTIPFNQTYIRIKAGSNIRETVKHIRETFTEIDPTFPIDVEFYDEVFNKLYKKEENLNKSITLLSILAIIISVVGVFGLILFETQYRRKEISIRKVHGATVGNILVMFNKVYIRIVCISFVIAAPVAYYIVVRWLENFVDKTPLYWWVFAVAFLIVGLITISTVTFQNWHTANINPAENIKSE